ncbi:MAG: 2,4-dihydroxyhept-2-ene-1,7-dioic acid aldolase [Candidatus Woesebacteria bacterium GW2011_GWA1_33_30]|uniref:2,4-dihydroxyhept-2-ene-1,7-dioic acid aldolase n=1 Tax=Candidatus Woesebacteria bacterium GW2011_GWA2_33_28 TaxID=1618561 RepID=A0A0G0C408_9BACT|nr:MAG: 2,4-dihydroxyhept-2-ene-1,7-dioic acid aldolase [Candidatus Woesebacteria bacterium GW2011_GWA2_33_28]KKP46336.1 MAG: 2,4-dihydroxyhept-2-ene-1,7-dioic acid aldolase [Candidatus Woesebacteria bacterium GW2011_GWA1_33_30]KKP47831.1 MAG: 2,4-dihydroxyhept-2-ene-1,7-dioic acid aldolase [Microgenomates group bacterium GW2011_GWC1_33_32]KKP51269.1 MAG: 2,4-dihydroxyhept-2-ene-1,7-dioic acid aldolase [Candidatus Woesebacteria bacterium GW2011_GWB1_33_38]
MFNYISIFKKWFNLKILLHKTNFSNIYFKQNDIWWCSVGMNLGEEIFGKGNKFTRPVLIFKKFTSNSFLGLPLTSKGKSGSWYTKISGGGKDNWVILNQARILDKKRLVDKMYVLDDRDIKKVKKDFLRLYRS